jgi:YVTN family beta-propeller protein
LGVSEAIAEEPGGFFHPSFLVTHDDPRATYGAEVNNRRMQPSVAERLDRLLDLIAASPATGRLQVLEAYVPDSGDLRELGRALRLRQLTPALPPGQLGALAHAAGFTHVRRQGTQIHVRQGPGEILTIAGPDEVAEEASIELAVAPRATPAGIAIDANRAYVANSGTDTVSEVDLASGRVLRALKVGWEPVAVVLSPDGARLYSADARSNTVTALDLASGDTLAVIPVEPEPVALAHHPTQPRLFVACRANGRLQAVDTGALAVLNTITVGLRPTGMALRPDGAEVWVALDQMGQVTVVDTSPFAPVASIGLAGEPFDIAITPDGARAYATLPNAGDLAILDVAGRNVVDVVSVGGVPGAVAVAPDGLTLYLADRDPAEERLHLLEPDGTPRPTAGSVRVRREPADVAAAADRVYVPNRGSDEVSVINPDPAQTALVDIWRLGSGLGERLTWVLRLGAAARARLGSTTATRVTVHGENAGPALARAVYALRDNTEHYTFEVRLKPALEAAGAIIRKDQYDLIMNILNALHPIGVEVSTRAIRERVIEVRDDLLDAFPDYTFPNFRVRGPVPTQREKE